MFKKFIIKKGWFFTILIHNVIKVQIILSCLFNHITSSQCTNSSFDFVRKTSACYTKNANKRSHILFSSFKARPLSIKTSFRSSLVYFKVTVFQHCVFKQKSIRQIILAECLIIILNHHPFCHSIYLWHFVYVPSMEVLLLLTYSRIQVFAT